MSRIVVTVPSLRVRKGPGAGYPILKSVRQGQRLTPTGATQKAGNYEWAQISAPVAGWVALSYTAPAGSDDAGFHFEAWPTDDQTITQPYGANPEYYARFGLPGHEGVDIRAPMNANIYAVAAGKVKMIATDPRPRSAGGHNYGIHIRITHAHGYETIYAHLNAFRVLPGQAVAAGELIGFADNTGNSYGSHVHLTLKRHGLIIDPTPYLNAVRRAS